MAAYHSSHAPRHFGENYVQELIEKANDPRLVEHCPDLRWHLIGHLQTNKARMVVKQVKNLEMVESVDSRKLATELNKACELAHRGTRLPVLIQVNTSGEESKYGCAPDEAVGLYGHVLAQCPRLEPRGLMTIGRLADTPQPDCFELLARIKKQVCEAFAKPSDAATPSASTSTSTSTPSIAASPFVDPSTFELSMGMSGDYECAMERGSTIVRIGSTIFGARDYGAKKTESGTTTQSISQSESGGQQAKSGDSSS